MTLFSIFAKPYPIHSKPYMIHRDKSIDVPIVVYLGRFDPPHPDPGRLDHHDRRSSRQVQPFYAYIRVEYPCSNSSIYRY